MHFMMCSIYNINCCNNIKVVNGSVQVRVHGGPGTGTVKEKVEPDLDPKPFRNRFLGSRIGTKTIYGTSLDPGPGLSRK